MMATFFGEVILPSSRADFDDDDDSNSEDQVKPREIVQVDIKDEAAVKSNYDILILSDGSIARDFVHNYMVENEKVTVAEFSTSPIHEIHDETQMMYSKKMSNKPISVGTLYKIGPSVLYLDASKFLKLTDANYLTVKVEQWINKCKEIVILASRPHSDYKCDAYYSLPPTFVKSLSSSNSSLPPSCNRMESPNFITGIGASVMTLCEVRKMNCTLHVCYTDALFSDSSILAPLLQCISNTSVSHLVQSKAPDLLKHVNPLHLGVMYQ